MEAVKRKAFVELIQIRGRFPSGGQISLTGVDPFYAMPFRIGVVCAALGGSGLAANDLWALKSGHRQKVSVNARSAAASLLPANGLNDKMTLPGSRAPLGPFLTKDRGLLLPHFEF